MNTKLITCCRVCPYYDGSDKEMAVCTHTDAPKEAYKNIVSRSHFGPEPVKAWCPLIHKNYTPLLIKRDSNDKIIRKIKLIVINKP